jgi:hypothetical protein
MTADSAGQDGAGSETVGNEGAVSNGSTRLAYILDVPRQKTSFENGRRWERSSGGAT